MAQDAHARLLAGALLDFRGHSRANSAQPGFAVLLGAASSDIVFPLFSRTFGYNDEGEVLAFTLAFFAQASKTGT